mmetsp:Transcript_41662/g.77908  ORF Transcript_41662/g.77908 Transcript_41662/m.77908 type:complete len:213 (-) Transcript_41662:147-785(-)
MDCLQAAPFFGVSGESNASGIWFQACHLLKETTKIINDSTHPTTYIKILLVRGQAGEESLHRAPQRELGVVRELVVQVLQAELLVVPRLEGQAVEILVGSRILVALSRLRFCILLSGTFLFLCLFLICSHSLRQFCPLSCQLFRCSLLSSKFLPHCFFLCCLLSICLLSSCLLSHCLLCRILLGSKFLRRCLFLCSLVSSSLHKTCLLSCRV